MSTFQLDLHAGRDVVVYDQNWCEPAQLSPESFVGVVLLKLERSFSSVHLLSGGSRSASLLPGSGSGSDLLAPLRWLPGVLPALPGSV